MVTHSDQFALMHEIFVLDAHIKEALDQSKAGEITRNLIDSLLSTLRMEELGVLQIYPATDLRAPGWSFLQPITTSHISGHYFEKPSPPHIRMDFYSCCSVDWSSIINTVHSHLNLADWRGTFIDRQLEQDSVRQMFDIAGNADKILFEAPIEAQNAFSRITDKKKEDVVMISV